MTKFNFRAFVAVLCLILLIVSTLIHLGSDHKAPVIHFSDAEIVYQEGEDTKDLLTKLRAEDNRDGDVTDKVFVVSVTPNNDQTKAVVLYGVEDKAHNAATAARTVTYQATGAAPASTDDNATEGNASDSGSDKKDSKTDKTSGNNAGQNAEETSSNQNTDTTASTEGTTENGQETAASGPVQSQNTNAAAPVVTLSSSQFEIQAGSRFNPVSAITSITDDKDKQNTLFRRVSVSGDYNVNKAGTYPIQIFVTDSDGNTSTPVSFDLVVK
jgi:hypothetical protein